jgi:hypothetical protein
MAKKIIPVPEPEPEPEPEEIEQTKEEVEEIIDSSQSERRGSGFGGDVISRITSQ